MDSEQARCELETLWSDVFGDVLGESKPDPIVLGGCWRQWDDRAAAHLPLTLALLDRPGGADSPKGKRYVLLLAGYSAEQLALCAGVHLSVETTTVIVPVSSKLAWKAVEESVRQHRSELGFLKPAIDPLVEVDPSSPADVFRKLLGWLRGHPGVAVTIDSTGGKKPMDAGAIHAASWFDKQAWYLDFEHYDDVARRPRPWTCHYRRLELPDAVFSLRRRKAIAEAANAYRYDAALGLATDLLAGMTERREYFDKADIDGVERARDTLDRAAKWVAGDYAGIAGHAIEGVFRAQPGESVKDFAHRARNLPPFGMDLVTYVVDEYWRVWLLRETGQRREAIIGAVGLAERIVDALVEQRLAGGSPVLAAGTALLRGESAHVAEGKPFLPGWLPNANVNQKTKLLRKGEAKFHLCLTPSKDGRPPSLDVSWNKTSLEATLVVRCAALANGLSNRLWEDHWGNGSNGKWFEIRHAVAHTRAALPPATAGDEIDAAIDTYLPRFVELLVRVVGGTALDLGRSADETWVTFKTTTSRRREDCMPWDTGVARRMLRQQLGVEA